MDVLTADDLRMLISTPERGSGGVCLSIYMPTHRAGWDVQQDPIRFKNLINRAEQRLGAQTLGRGKIGELLEPLERLQRDDVFWQYQDLGLALFSSEEMLRYYRVPLEFEELLVVAGRFHIKPLLPLISVNGRFYILALSLNKVRLLRGTRDTVSDVDLEGVPESLAEALRYDEPKQQLQFHTTTVTPAGASVPPSMKGERPAIFHGQGGGGADDPKNNIRRYFQQLEEGVSGFLGEKRIPLILAGVDYLHPLYREVNTYPYLAEEGIGGNPDELSADELHRRAWSLIRPVFASAQAEAIARYKQMKGAGIARASNDLEEIVPGAYFERVDTLIVAQETQRWGSFNPQANLVCLHPDPQPGDEDLLDLAAVHTVLNGGSVYAVEPHEIPDGEPVAAIFRY